MSPFRFEPIYIPPELKFDNKTGNIYGSFHHFGDYLIGIKVKDSLNREMQILIKVSIKDASATAPKFIFYRRSLIQVNLAAKNTPIPNSMLPSSN